MEFPFYLFLSSDLNLQILFFIFFCLASMKMPCQDLPTVEYSACALSCNFYSII